ncbi:MAG: carbamoyltransferase HypF [Pirellulales bacterium]|nr:carbamoyltransferase HypF [Pirellulales bacterium]
MERRAVTVRGIVQGVGFRPFLSRLAREFGLVGSVRNVSGAVCIEIEGEALWLDRFCTELGRRRPPLAVIDEIAWQSRACIGEPVFTIAESSCRRSGDVFIPPDVATCDDCLRELFDPTDRRYRYPFLNCTQCGPRLTIVASAPYDRQRTTMASFAMCAACRAEYEDPGNRRYHAQPTCCPRCGPRLQLLSPDGMAVEASDPIEHFASALRDARIGALKGLGGYHLVCDASNREAVSELRRRKHRDEKPFAVMLADVKAVARICYVDEAERALLRAPRCPIVLLRRRDRAVENVSIQAPLAEEVAPGNPNLGVMLPYSPLHHLLVEATGDMPLVMTSGNRSDEPIAYEDGAALSQLAGIADLFLTHDRPIQVRCDDSVTRVIASIEAPLRRSRGYAPAPIRLPVTCHNPILAVGGQLKNTFALGREHSALVSHHLGDLDHFEAFRAFQRDIHSYEELFDIQPRVIVHDLHPDYASTTYAQRRAAAAGLDTLAVQHHHAHVAACMAEHGLRGDVLGVAFDGTGLGTDGAIWGGEFLIADYEQFRRAAHLRYVPLPGGDRAIREPWRMAVSHAADAACQASLATKVPTTTRMAVKRMIDRRLNCPPTSSVGRLFDAVAALSGVRDVVTFEAQAAMELEWLATDVPPDRSYPFEIDRPALQSTEVPDVVDTRPIIRAVFDDLCRGIGKERIARRFHSTLVEIIAAVCARMRETTRLDRVVLTGGVFTNALLTSEATIRLTDDGFRVFRHQFVPANDGGLSLGQLAVGAAVTANRVNAPSLSTASA